MSTDRRNTVNKELRALVTAGNLMELELDQLADKGRGSRLAKKDIARFRTLAHSWHRSLNAFRDRRNVRQLKIVGRP